MKTITYDALEVRTHASREALGEAAAVVAAETIREACDLRGGGTGHFCLRAFAG